MRLSSLWVCVVAFGLSSLGGHALGQEKASDKASSKNASEASSSRVASERLLQAKAALQDLVDKQLLAGAVIMASHHSEIILSESVGYARIESKRPMEIDSIFRIYSMTKAITSVAVMQLVERGDVQLDDPVAKYLPELVDLKLVAEPVKQEAKPTSPVSPNSPTIRDLLRHTAGLTYGIFGDTSVDRMYRASGILSPGDSSQKLVEKLGKLPLLDPPATRFRYSVASDVLGRLIEVVSGNNLGDQFAKAIFVPLEMKDTHFSVPAGKVDRFVDNHGPREGRSFRVIDSATVSSFLHPPTFLSGGGGLVSTAPDYMRFCQMLCGMGERNGVRILRAETVREMTQNQLPSQAYPIEMEGQKRLGVGFGLGFSVVVEPIPGFDYVPVGEYGWGGAASTHFWISPKHELAVVVMSQHMPFTFQCESAVKPLLYKAIE